MFTRSTKRNLARRHTLVLLFVRLIDLQLLKSVSHLVRLDAVILQGLSELASLVFARATPKTFRGKTLTGPLLVSMLRGAVEAANKSEGQLVIGSMWNSMLDAELARAAAAAREAYEQGAKELAACSVAGQAEAIHKVNESICIMLCLPDKQCLCR
jgi:hypothetical protein